MVQICGSKFAQVEFDAKIFCRFTLPPQGNPLNWNVHESFAWLPHISLQSSSVQSEVCVRCVHSHCTIKKNKKNLLMWGKWRKAWFLWICIVCTPGPMSVLSIYRLLLRTETTSNLEIHTFGILPRRSPSFNQIWVKITGEKVFFRDTMKPSKKALLKGVLRAERSRVTWIAWGNRTVTEAAYARGWIVFVRKKLFL